MQQSLTNDPGRLQQAIQDLPGGMHEGTRLDLAFDVGVIALQDPKGDPWNNKR